MGEQLCSNPGHEDKNKNFTQVTSLLTSTGTINYKMGIIRLSIWISHYFCEKLTEAEQQQQPLCSLGIIMLTIMLLTLTDLNIHVIIPWTMLQSSIRTISCNIVAVFTAALCQYQH